MSEPQDDLFNSTFWIDAGAPNGLKTGESQFEITTNAFVAGTVISLLFGAEFWIDAAAPNKFVFAEAQIEINSFKVTVGREIVFGQANLSGSVNATVTNSSVFQPGEPEEPTGIKNLLVINNKAITEHNRTFSSSVISLFIQNQNWDSRRSRYQKIQNSRRTFSISWSFLPNRPERTVDLRLGRDFIKSIAEDPDYHVLKMINMDSDGLTPPSETEYNVVVKNYTETLIRRDVGDDTYYWDCSLELEEIG